MSTEQALFYLLSALIAFAGIKFLIAKETIHAVLYFFLTLMATAGLFFMLNAPFVAAMQILVYGGAITVLVLFVVMLTALDQPEIDTFKASPAISLVLSVVLLVSLISSIFSNSWNRSMQYISDKGTLELARVMFRDYVVPFEMASILLLVALIGAIYLASARKETE